MFIIGIGLKLIIPSTDILLIFFITESDVQIVVSKLILYFILEPRLRLPEKKQN